ncbi:SH3 domain-containing protein [Clostridium lundense]|uniref:SH3 domain-containing protein n=1 Tax=Clostridium lundense TaxID=319475 RepID=UPI000684EFF6|nr:SH3 domain-containing protein [Clostridium lundense]
MNKLKNLIIVSCITASIICNPITISVKAYTDNLLPNTLNDAYNKNNIFTVYGYKGQCTWFTYGRALEKLNVKLPNAFYGNAVEWWYDNVNKNVFPYGEEPKANSIVVWSGGNLGYGHVAFVEKVENDTVYFNEGNFSVRGDYDQKLKNLSKESMKQRGNLYLKGYIYLDEADKNTSNESPEQASSITEKYKYGIPKISNGSTLNIRLNPSTSSKICGTLKKGDTFSILSKVADWYKIKFNSTTGYVNSEYVTLTNKGPAPTKPSNNTPNTTSNKKYGLVVLRSKNSGLNLRNSPSEKGKIINSIPNNTKIEILGTTNGWHKVNYKGLTGYLSSQFVKAL